MGMLGNQLYVLACGIDQILSVELLRAGGLAPLDPDVRTGKRKASDESAENEGEEGENSGEEGDEAQLKALTVCPPSLPAHVIDPESVSLGKKMKKIQAKLQTKAAKSKPPKKVKREHFKPVSAGEVIDLT